MKSLFLIRFRPAVIILCTLIGATSLATGAAIGVAWTKSDVVPVVLVKPGMIGFEPIQGTSIGISWPKDEVKPVVLVTPSFGGFGPAEGNSIGNIWTRNQTVPVMLVEPYANAFVPSAAVSDQNAAAACTPTPAQSNGPKFPPAANPLPAVIETQIDGDFEGWEGETLVKTTDGHIWQQSEYYYEYHYAFMPKVMIYKVGGGYKMKVEGVTEPVPVKQLK